MSVLWCLVGLVLVVLGQSNLALGYGKRIHNFTLDPLIEGDTREIFWYEQMIVIKDMSSENEVRRCDAIEVYENGTDPIEDYEVIMQYFLPDYEVKELFSMEEMAEVMRACDSVDDQSFLHNFFDAVRPYVKAVRAISPFIFGSQSFQEEAQNAGKEITGVLDKVWRNILPRTKWCGRGNVADSFHDLGELRAIDRCCRAHDFCPMKIVSNDVKWGLKNENDFTTSHCVCDTNFYDCLKSTKEYMAGQIGLLYFSYLRPKCIDGFPTKNASSYKDGEGDNIMRLAPNKRTWYESNV